MAWWSLFGPSLPPERPAWEMTTPEPAPVPLTAAEITVIRAMPLCPYCGGRHVTACPYIARMRMHPTNGKVVEVVFVDAFQDLIADILYLDDDAVAEGSA